MRLAGRTVEWPWIIPLLVPVGTLYIRIAYWAIRWRRDTAHLDEALSGNRPIIFCVWHGRQLMMSKLWPAGFPLWVVGSNSFDGRLALAAARKFGIRTIERSRTAGKAQAVRAILRALKDGASVGVTPDGSKGPRMNVNPGIIDIARMSGAPLVPAAYSCSHGIAFSSWDRFIAPFPFGRGVFLVGEPINVQADADPAAMEAARQTLESRLNAITMLADRSVGREPIMPAPRIAPESAGTL